MKNFLFLIAIFSLNVLSMDEPVQKELRNIDRVLLVASQKNNNVNYALSLGADPNIHDERYIEVDDQETIFTPLLYACWMCNKTNVELLLQHKADVNLNSLGALFSPLFIALLNPDIPREHSAELAKFLIKQGADCTFVGGKNNSSILQKAVILKNPELIDILLSNKSINLNHINDLGCNILSDAVMVGERSVVKKLFDLGVKPIVDNNGFTLMHLAANCSRVDIIQELFERGFDINALSKSGYTPLHVASRQPNFAMVKKLLDLGANPNIKTKQGFTALQLSEENPDKNVQELLKKPKEAVQKEAVQKETVQKKQKKSKKKNRSRPTKNQSEQTTAGPIQPTVVGLSTQSTNIPNIQPNTAPQITVKPIETQVPNIQPEPKLEVKSRAEQNPPKKSSLQQGISGVAEGISKGVEKVKKGAQGIEQGVKTMLNPQEKQEAMVRFGTSYAAALGVPVRQQNSITIQDEYATIVVPVVGLVRRDKNPLIGLNYSSHVGEKMQDVKDLHHNYSKDVDNELGWYVSEHVLKSASKKHSAKIMYMVSGNLIMGENNIHSGHFEWTVQDGTIWHRFFVGHRIMPLLKSAPAEYKEKESR